MIKSIINFIFFNRSFEKKIEQTYKILKKNNKIEQIYEIKEKIQKLKNSKNKLDSSFEDYDLDIYLSLRQFIYSRFINTNFFTSRLMFAIANEDYFYFPITKDYLDIISKFTKVSYFKSKVLLILIITFYTVFQLIIIIKNSLFFFKFKKNYKKKIFLNSIPELYSGKLNQTQETDFFKWSLKKFEISNKVNFIHCNKLIEDKKIFIDNINYETNFVTNPLLPFYKFIYFRFFIKSFLKTIYLSIRCVLVNKSELLFLIKEIFYFNFLKELPNQIFYDYCLFNNSNMVFRPLWTYVNEKKNKNSVVFYFYSTNMVPLLQEINQNSFYETYGYSLHSWPTYIVWNEQQEKWLKKYVNFNCKFIKVSSIPFIGKHSKLVKKNKTLTIFDVPPKKKEIYYQLNNAYNIYTFKYCQKFITDIVNSIPDHDYNKLDLFLKLKKDYINIDPDYRNLIKKLVDNKKVSLITDISPESIIDISDGVISIPFTTPAITALNNNRDTIYYDPSGKLTKENSFEKKIQLISTKSDLENWVLKILEK